jgi:hypothetical protein
VVAEISSRDAVLGHGGFYIFPKDIKIVNCPNGKLIIYCLKILYLVVLFKNPFS